MPGVRLQPFALSSSYVEDVIEGKHEYENLENIYPISQEPAKTVLDMLVKAPQLVPLTKDEINTALCKIQEFHGRAYEWSPNVSPDSLVEATRSGAISCAPRSGPPSSFSTSSTSTEKPERR